MCVTLALKARLGSTIDPGSSTAAAAAHSSSDSSPTVVTWRPISAVSDQCSATMGDLRGKGRDRGRVRVGVGVGVGLRVGAGLRVEL